MSTYALLLEASSTLSGVTEAMSSLPDPSPAQPPGVGDRVDTILGWLFWGGLIACIVGIVIVGTMMAISHNRGEGARHIGGLGYALVGVVVISAAVSLVTTLQ